MDLMFKKIGKLFAGASSTGGSDVIGIDFGSSSIKVVQLRQEGESISLVTYGELQLGPYADTVVGSATSLDPSRLIEALLDIVREASVTSTYAGVAIPYASSFVAIITLAAQDPAQLPSMVPIEARKYVPVPINQVTLDWFPVPEKNGIAAPGKTRILLAAIHNEALSKYRAVVQGAQLKSAFNEIEIFSTIRSSVQNVHETVLILDIGAATTKLYIVSEGMVQGMHSINVGGQDMTSSLSKSLEISKDDAEEMKRQVGLTAKDNPRIERALSFALERIFSDIRKMLMSYERDKGVPPVSSVVFAGGGSALKGLEDYALSALGRRIVRADPFSKVGYPAFLKTTLDDIGPSFSVAVGVALRALSEK